MKNSLEQLLTKLLKISSGNTGVPDASLDRIGMIKLFQVVARLLYHGPSVFRSTLSKPEVRSFIAMGPHNSWIKHTEEQEEMFLGSAFYDYMKVCFVHLYIFTLDVCLHFLFKDSIA